MLPSPSPRPIPSPETTDNRVSDAVTATEAAMSLTRRRALQLIRDAVAEHAHSTNTDELFSTSLAALAALHHAHVRLDQFGLYLAQVEHRVGTIPPEDGAAVALEFQAGRSADSAALRLADDLGVSERVRMRRFHQRMAAEVARGLGYPVEHPGTERLAADLAAANGGAL